jgi:hypothetical protein
VLCVALVLLTLTIALQSHGSAALPTQFPRYIIVGLGAFAPCRLDLRICVCRAVRSWALLQDNRRGPLESSRLLRAVSPHGHTERTGLARPEPRIIASAAVSESLLQRKLVGVGGEDGVIARARRRNGTLGRAGRRHSPERAPSVLTEAGGSDVSPDPAATAASRHSSPSKCRGRVPRPGSSLFALAECCHDQATEEDEGERFKSHFALVVRQSECR